jgi:arylsulfatase A-like enzyme
VVTDRYKLVHFYKDADYWELFDLQKDPEELRSVYGQPGYAALQSELGTELARLRKELKELPEDPARASGDETGANEKAKRPAGTK